MTGKPLPADDILLPLPGRQGHEVRWVAGFAKASFALVFLQRPLEALTSP